MNKGKVSISYSKLRMISLVYIALPLFSFFRGINDKETDYIVTLDRDSNPDPHSTGWPPTNFVSLDYDDVFFFKYFARDRRTSL